MSASTAYSKYFDLDGLIKNIKSYLPDFNVKLFREAFRFAEEAHKGQMRKDKKTPYIVHPIKAVEILAEFHADEATLIAAVLHDVPEDTMVDIQEIEHRFGKEVSFLVDGVTKLSKMQYRHNMDDRAVESLKKLFLHSSKDLRAIVIKLADRLHNMETLNFVRPEKRVRIASETLEIFVPIANLLGINKLKTDLEDLCFKHLFATEYEKLRVRIKDSHERNKSSMEAIMRSIKTALKANKIDSEIMPREKGLYRAYKRICSIGKTIESIKDRIAIKVVVDKKDDCYQALGVIHNLFTPKPGSFKDYVANPKSNGYQSLHTMVFGVDGIVTEIQIQTKRMKMEAAYGIASIFFSDGKKDDLFKNDKRRDWMNKILMMEKEKPSQGDFLSDLKIDILQERIFLFTPKGETIDLPKGASVIDFSYAIHSDIGNHAQKAEINGEILPVTTVLKTGDEVKVLVDEKSMPELHWLSFTKTSLARNKILMHLKKVSREKKIKEGKNILQKEFDIIGLGLCEGLNIKKIRSKINEQFSLNIRNLKDLFTSIGEGTLKPLDIVKILKNNGSRSLWWKKVDNEPSKCDKIVTFKVLCVNRFGLSKDIFSIVYTHAKDVIFFKGWTGHANKNAYYSIKVVVDDMDRISHIFEELEQLENVKSVYKISAIGRRFFYSASALIFIFWIIHPRLFAYVVKIGQSGRFPVLADLVVLITGLLLIFSVFFIIKLIKTYYPTFRNSSLLYFLYFSSSLFAISVVSHDFYVYQFGNIVYYLVAGSLVFAYLLSDYLSFRNLKNS
ncbi:RelA/SpoT family protein [Patescibacteria group bacterium]|nr:RelA/SpoT family protein [Patescibacteria group bacterium]